jgi:hypothetical protein
LRNLEWPKFEGYIHYMMGCGERTNPLTIMLFYFAYQSKFVDTVFPTKIFGKLENATP